MAAACSGELSTLVPLVDSCPQDNEYILFTNVAGVNGGYAFRTWGKVKSCLLAGLNFIFQQFKVGDPGAPILQGQDTLIINQTGIIQDSVFITLGGPELPRDDTTQLSYIVDYSNPSLITITFFQPVVNGQQYILHYCYA